MWARGGGDSEPAPIWAKTSTMLEPMATPSGAQPHFLANRTASPPVPPRTPTLPTRLPPASLPSPLSIIGCSSTDTSSLKLGVTGCWLATLPVHLQSGQWESRPFRKGWGTFQQETAAAGGGVRVHATHSVNQRTWKGRGNSPGPPTHYSSWTRCYSRHHSLAGRFLHTQNMTRLSYLPDKIQTRPLHQKTSFYSVPPFF